jgi:hypothetical protein
MKLELPSGRMITMRSVEWPLYDTSEIQPMDGSALNALMARMQSLFASIDAIPSGLYFATQHSLEGLPENTWFLCNEKALYNPKHEIFIAAVGWSLQEFKIYNRDLVEVRDESQGRSTPEPSLEDVRIAPSICALGNLKND